jgi:hypothetical protein
MILATRNARLPFPKAGGDIHMTMANQEWQDGIEFIKKKANTLSE